MAIMLFEIWILFFMMGEDISDMSLWLDVFMSLKATIFTEVWYFNIILMARDRHIQVMCRKRVL